MNPTREEQEFNVEWVAAESCAHISTTDPVMMRRMDRLVANHPDVYEFVRGDEMSKSYRCKNKRLCWPRAPRAAREMTNEQRAAAAERLRAAREGAQKSKQPPEMDG